MGYHPGKADCIQTLSIELAELNIEQSEFEQAWKALGVVVAALYRRLPPADVMREEPQRKAVYSVCPHCGFESVTARGTKLHVARIHPDQPRLTA